jgi:hypothetical protein
MGTLMLGRLAALFLAAAAAAVLGTTALAADPSPAPSPTPSPSASVPPDCGVTDFRTCLDTSTADVTQTIWGSMSQLVANAASSVILSLGCELAATSSSDVTPPSQATPGQQCSGQQSGQSVQGLTSPDLTGAYFNQYYQRSAAVAALIAMGIGIAAAAFFAVTRNGIRLIYAGIGYPSMVALGIVIAPGLLATILRLTDDLGFYVAGPVQISSALQNLAGIYSVPSPAGPVVAGGTAPPVFLVMVTAMAAVLFGLIGIIELLARSVAIYLVVLFWPLALASSAWGGGFGLARRFLRVIVAVIVAKPVMVIVVSLGVGLIATAPLDLISMIEGVMLLLVALLAPLVPFALFGGAEAAVVGQLQVRERLERAMSSSPESGPAPAAAGAGGGPGGANGAAAAPPGASTVVVAPVVGGRLGKQILRKSSDGSVEAG